MTWDPASDAELQELYRLAAPGPQSFLPGYPPESIALAGRLRAAAEWRAQVISSEDFCRECWVYEPGGCWCENPASHRPIFDLPTVPGAMPTGHRSTARL